MEREDKKHSVAKKALETKEPTRKPTKGHVKMRRYIDDLVRREDFMEAIKNLGKLEKDFQIPSGKYDEWTPEQQKKHDALNAELASIIEGYGLLRKRANKLLQSKYSLYRHQIAYDFGLDGFLQNFAKALIEKDPATIQFWEQYIGGDADMCMWAAAYMDEMWPTNEGDEIIHLSPQRQLSLIAYPVAIRIHSRAAKADVLDYIEKQWIWIESLLRQDGAKLLKLRKRKHSQEMLDFIWDNQNIPAKKLEKMIDEKFPHNGLIYSEIYKLISLEKEKRLGK